MSTNRQALRNAAAPGSDIGRCNCAHRSASLGRRSPDGFHPTRRCPARRAPVRSTTVLLRFSAIIDRRLGAFQVSTGERKSARPKISQRGARVEKLRDFCGLEQCRVI
jgi:hypothetical protein